MTTIQRSTENTPVHALSALALALGDWTAMGLNIVTAMDLYWVVSLGAALAAALMIYAVEHFLTPSTQRAALLKAACAVPLIVLPFPVAGSVVALALLIWLAVRALTRRG